MLNLLFLFLMVAIFIGGLVLIGEARQKRPNFPSCKNCNYNLSGLADKTDCCPECGLPMLSRNIRKPREPFTNTLILFLGIALVLIPLPICCIGDVILSILFGPP